MSHISMKEQPESCRPYERCLKHGAEYLSDAELLAVIIRSGTKTRTSVEVAADVLNATKIHEGLQGLVHLSVPELTAIPGIGEVKAIQIVCVAELARRIGSVRAGEKEQLLTPDQIGEAWLPKMRFLEQEEMILLLLNTKHALIKEIRLAKGTVNASVITPREVLVEALRYQAVCLVIMHNHPSGDPEPSDEDILFTERLVEAAAYIGIRVSDHIVFGSDRYISFKERGLI